MRRSNRFNRLWGSFGSASRRQAEPASAVSADGHRLRLAGRPSLEQQLTADAGAWRDAIDSGWADAWTGRGVRSIFRFRGAVQLAAAAGLAGALGLGAALSGWMHDGVRAQPRQVVAYPTVMAQVDPPSPEQPMVDEANHVASDAHRALSVVLAQLPAGAADSYGYSSGAGTDR